MIVVSVKTDFHQVLLEPVHQAKVKRWQLRAPRLLAATWELEEAYGQKEASFAMVEENIFSEE